MKTKISMFILLLFFLAQVHAQTFKAGAAKRDITPDHLLPISGGMGAPEMPTDFKGKLTVRALVLENGLTRVAIVGVDNIGWPSYLGDLSRKKIKDVAPQNILIGVTHTHSAPDAYGFTDEKGNTGADMEYLKWCADQIALAVNEAASKLEPVSLKTAVDKANGKIAYNYYAPELYDKRMGVIQVIATTARRH